MSWPYGEGATAEAWPYTDGDYVYFTAVAGGGLQEARGIAVRCPGLLVVPLAGGTPDTVRWALVHWRSGAAIWGRSENVETVSAVAAIAHVMAAGRNFSWLSPIAELEAAGHLALFVAILNVYGLTDDFEGMARDAGGSAEGSDLNAVVNPWKLS